MGYSYRTDLKRPGVYTITLDGDDVGVLSFVVALERDKKFRKRRRFGWDTAVKHANKAALIEREHRIRQAESHTGVNQ